MILDVCSIRKKGSVKYLTCPLVGYDTRNMIHVLDNFVLLFLKMGFRIRRSFNFILFKRFLNTILPQQLNSPLKHIRELNTLRY